nr:S8/S53 family peptidase [Microbacterium halimionae]
MPANAADGSQYWYDAYGVPAAQSEGWTGAGTKIAVIDDQINPELPVFADANLTISEVPICAEGSATSTQWNTGASHGSTSTALLVGNGEGQGAVRGIAPEAEVTFYGFGRGDAAGTEDCGVPQEATDQRLSRMGWGIERAMNDGADVISISMGATNFDVGDEGVISEAIATGVVIVASTDNSAIEPVDEFPWSFNGVVAVNAMDADTNLQTEDTEPFDPVTFPATTVVALGVNFSTIGGQSGWDSSPTATGASLATPLVAGMLALTKQKYPDATGNQLIQSLIHNTWADDHALERDTVGGFGYGAASLTHLLREDPSQYADDNPLMDKPWGSPTAEQVAAVSGTAPTPSASATPAAVEVPAETDSEMPGWLLATIIGGIVLVIALIAATILVVVLITRRKKNITGGKK